MQNRSILTSIIFLALSVPASPILAQEPVPGSTGDTTRTVFSGTGVLACWDFSGLTPGNSLFDGERISDACGDHDARVVDGLAVVDGVTPATGALAFTSASADALVFEPAFDFGDGDPPAGQEFDFAGDDSFTIEAIVRIPAAFTGVGSIISKDVGPGQASWWSRVSNGVFQGFVGDSDSQELITGHQIINDGQWHHIALVRVASDNSLNLYVDYHLDESVNIPPLDDIETPVGTPIVIGAFNNGTRQLQGDMQMARITREELSPSQFLLHDEVANLSVTITHDGQPLTPGETTEYEIRVSNAGPMAAAGVVVEALMPAEFSGTTWTCMADSGSSCSASGNGDLIDSVALLADQSAVYTVEADLVMDLPPQVTYMASIESATQIDFNPDDNMASVTTWIGGGTELRLHVNQSAAAGGNGASWATPFRYLQDALAEARILAVEQPIQIWVARGVYYPDEGAGQTNNSRSSAFVLADQIYLYGGFDGTETSLGQRDWLANPTVLSGDIDQNDSVNSDGLVEHWNDIVGNNSYHVVRARDLESARLDGFHVTGGKADGGGLIDSAFLMRYGAGIHLRDSAVDLAHLRIQGNLARDNDGSGGGLYSESAPSSTVAPELTDIVFEHNRSGWGGGMAITRGTVFAEGVRFYRNQANRSGGAVYMSLGRLTIHNSVFTGNSAEESGGAIYNFRVIATLVSSLLSGNYASDLGGAYYFDVPAGLIHPLIFTNSTLTGNRAGNTGGAIHRDEPNGEQTYAYNTIIWNNQDSTGVGTPSATHGGPAAHRLTARHSLLEGLDPGGETNFDGTDPANVPAFLQPISPGDAPTSAGDFRIDSDSPLIDAGDNQARINGFYAPETPIPIEGNILFDLAGRERILDGDGDGIDQIDLGPYESLGVQARFIGGTVSGLAGNGLVLQNNAGDDLAVDTNGEFMFDTAQVDGDSYEVTVLSLPTSPSQTCTVTDGNGMVDGENVIDVQVECLTDTFTLGGTVSGLSGDGLVLQNNGGGELAIEADGVFSFATALSDGSAYNVTVSAQPADPIQLCTVTSGDGTIDSSNVTNILVDCADRSDMIFGDRYEN